MRVFAVLLHDRNMGTRLDPTSISEMMELYQKDRNSVRDTHPRPHHGNEKVMTGGLIQDSAPNTVRIELEASNNRLGARYFSSIANVSVSSLVVEL